MGVAAAFNLFEAALWAVAGLMVFRKSRRQPPRKRRLGSQTAAVLCVFGLSDLIEARTGAWWDPWWLLLLKALCIVGLVAAGLRWRRIRALEKGS